MVARWILHFLFSVSRRSFRMLIPLGLLLTSVLAQGCTCAGETLPPPRGVIACRPQHGIRPTVTKTSADPAIETTAAGSIPGSFSITSTGDANFVMPLDPVPGRAGVAPQIALAYSGHGGDGVLGRGFSISGSSAITRCPSNLAMDGEILGVKYDANDKLCLDSKRLAIVEKEPSRIEYRTVPDSHVKVIGHDPDDGGTPGSFEVFLPSGFVIEYGTTPGTKPFGPGGVARAWLAAVARDGRGNAMTYGYCFANDAEYTAEYALDEIRYTSFEGVPAIEASRAVKFVYGPKDPVDIRALYSFGMALQSSLRLEEIQMVGPGEELVRSYAFAYSISPATSRTLLMQVEECSGDTCKPPTRFQYKNSEPGFKKHTTSITKPTSQKASPIVVDMDGDGLDDLVVPDTDPALSTPGNPITKWFFARNNGESPFLGAATEVFSQEWLSVDDPLGVDDLGKLQPEFGTVLDYNADGLKDIWLHDVYDILTTWQVLIARPGGTVELMDTGIRRPFPLNPPPSSQRPTLTRKGSAMHLADVNGDHVPDLIQCEDHDDTGQGIPTEAVWTAHLWKPMASEKPAGFDPEGERIGPLGGVDCDRSVLTADINADSKVDLIVQPMLTGGDGTKIPILRYDALTRHENGTWEGFRTRLRVPEPGGRVLFVDINADGLPDAVESGSSDGALWTYINIGGRFADPPSLSLGSPGHGHQDVHFNLAVPLDYDGDGRQDILMPVPGGTMPNQSNVLPAWAILQAKPGAQNDPDEATFTLVDPNLPLEVYLGNDAVPADTRAPRIGDLNGDGAADVVLLVGGFFNIFQGMAADQDVLVRVSDGMNDRDPEDPDFVPNVDISYGHLTDPSITSGVPANDPAMESALYLSRFDVANECAYPRRCAVGPRRVVSGYSLNDGSNGIRKFSARYRDARYHQLGLGFLGFGERIITDLDTLAGTTEFYDNVTFDAALNVFPFARQVKHQWRWAPGLQSQPKPEQIELTFLDIEQTVVPTSDGKSYFTIPTEGRLRHIESVYVSADSSPEAYARKVEANGGGTILRDTTAKVTDFDVFGHVLAEEISTVGVDLTLKVDRTFKNDTDRWVLGQLRTQKECGSASNMSQCRALTRTMTVFGEIETEAIETDDGSPETKSKIAYERDDLGNITGITAEDGFGKIRSSTLTYEPEGIFPDNHINAEGHTSIFEFDKRFGALAKWTDAHGLVTTREYDGFGRLALEKRPDGSETIISLSRAKNANGLWRLTQQTTTSGGADDVVEYDSLGRPIRWLWHGPSPQGPAGQPPRLMQMVEYDPLSGSVAKRSVPVSEGAAEMLFDRYQFDALGREVRHTTPWNAIMETAYDNNFVYVTDALKNVTTTEIDPLGRPVVITDAMKGETSYAYGPFGGLLKVTDPGGAATITIRDALGRVQELDDPDRGTTIQTWNGFGELISSTDALGRVSTFEHDGLGRPKSRIDKQNGVLALTTTWTWDTAPNGIGKLHTLASPDGTKTFLYNSRGQLESTSLTVTGPNAILEGKLGYDQFGRVETITYPTPSGAAPFVITQDHDPFGHVIKVHDGATNYWQLKDVDNAGRFREEVFGNKVTSERSYFADKQSLKSIITSGATPVQSLAYDYDARLSLKSRTDTLQPQHKTERFRYDGLDRLTCAYFSPNEDPFAPCATSYGYAPNGNLTFKSDVGILAYNDPKHPHAVTSAGADSFGYDAIGNQIARPGGVTLSHTPFDLPKLIEQGALPLATYGYDGDQTRIRKTTPDEETLYFDELYERVTKKQASTKTEHRYYIHSPERMVAVVTRGGDAPGTVYLHADHLGSVDALTNANGAVVERRSYDAFGQRRDPIWGMQPPASFTSKTTRGFTGHEHDAEFGLVNAKGRIYDPRLGRFLSTDPIISNLFSGQTLNAYSYVTNNPLSFVDPSGFEPEKPPILPIREEVWTDANGEIHVDLFYPPREARPSAEQAEAAEFGVSAPPTDVDTTGNSAEIDAQSITTAPEEGLESNTAVRGGLGFSYGVGQAWFPGGVFIPSGSPRDSTFEFWRGAGQFSGGVVEVAAGVGLIGGGAGAAGGGIAGAVPTGGTSLLITAAGWSAVTAGWAAVAHGTTSIVAGLATLANSMSMMSSGSGSGGPGANAAAPATGKAPPLPTYAGAKTSGVLRTPSGDVPLISGYKGPSASMPRGTPGMNWRIKSHVEAHAAAIMRERGIKNATLYINRVPCAGTTGCGSMLQKMLPEGAQLRVIGPNGYDQIFVGLPD